MSLLFCAVAGIPVVDAVPAAVSDLVFADNDITTVPTQQAVLCSPSLKPSLNVLKIV